MLDKKILYDGIYEILTVPYKPATMKEFSRKFTKVYVDYAKKAVTFAENPIILSQVSAMQNLLDLLDSPANTVDVFANIVEQGVIAWWGTVVFAVAPFPPGFGVVTLVTHTNPKASSIAPGVKAGTLTPGKAAVKAAAYSDALHSATIKVLSSHFGLDITLLIPKTEIDKPIK